MEGEGVTDALRLVRAFRRDGVVAEVLSLFAIVPGVAVPDLGLIAVALTILDGHGREHPLAPGHVRRRFALWRVGDSIAVTGVVERDGAV